MPATGIARQKQNIAVVVTTDQPRLATTPEPSIKRETRANEMGCTVSMRRTPGASRVGWPEIIQNIAYRLTVRQHSDPNAGRRPGHTTRMLVNRCPTVAPVNRSHAASHTTTSSGNARMTTQVSRWESNAEAVTTKTA